MIYRVMRLKSFIERFTRSFCKYDIFTIVYRISGLFETCSMMIFLYHFNMFLGVFLRQNVRYFMQEYCIFTQFD